MGGPCHDQGERDGAGLSPQTFRGSVGDLPNPASAEVTRGRTENLGVHVAGFREFADLRGWLAGLEGGNSRNKGLKAGTRAQTAEQADKDTLGECIYSKT